MTDINDSLKNTSLIPPYMKFEYTKWGMKEGGHWFHRCIGATFGHLRAYDWQQADQVIKEPYRHNGDVIEPVLFRLAYPGPYFDFEGCAFSDVFAIDDCVVEYKPAENTTLIHDKPKIKEQLDFYNTRSHVQQLSKTLMFFGRIMKLQDMQPKKIMKNGKVDKNSNDYQIFKLIQKMNFDPTPRLTANRFFTSVYDGFDTSLLFKINPACYKLLTIEFGDMVILGIRFDRDANAKPGERITTIHEPVQNGMPALEQELRKIQQGRNEYVKGQYYIHS